MSLKKTVLFISPHTGDAELGAGEAIIRFLEEKKEIYEVAFSAARESLKQHGHPENLLELEFHSSMEFLGLSQEKYKLFIFPLRRFSEKRQDILDKLIELKKLINPNLIIILSQNDWHQDDGTNNIYETLKRFYGNCNEFPALGDLNNKIKNIRNYKKLSELNIDLNKYIINEIFPNKKFLVASDFSIKPQGKNRIIKLMKSVGGNEYISGTGAKAYQDSENFKANNLKLSYVDYPDIYYGKSSKLSDGFSIYDFIARERMENPFL